MATSASYAKNYFQKSGLNLEDSDENGFTDKLGLGSPL